MEPMLIYKDRFKGFSMPLFISGPKPSIDRVIFNNPATIVYWTDGSKTVVKCQPNDTYDKEKGIALCCMKKLMGNKGSYNDELKKWSETL